MNKTIWYGAKDNDVRFADSKLVLTDQGIDNAQSFTVEGEVSGLKLIGSEQQQHTGGAATA
jgi:hypothetical protein